MEYVFIPTGVCSRKIYLDVDGNIVKSVRFEGGCSGNTQGLAKMVEGLEINEVVKKLKGIRCGFKNTSCPDQLAVALEQIANKN